MGWIGDGNRMCWFPSSRPGRDQGATVVWGYRGFWFRTDRVVMSKRSNSGFESIQTALDWYQELEPLALVASHLLRTCPHVSVERSCRPTCREDGAAKAGVSWTVGHWRTRWSCCSCSLRAQYLNSAVRAHLARLCLAEAGSWREDASRHMPKHQMDVLWSASLSWFAICN